MGYGVQAWEVDLDRLRADVGCGDEAMAQRYAAEFSARSGDVQDFIDDVIDKPGMVTLADVARHMVMGEPYDERIGFAYGYFLQHLCGVHGTFLDNRSLMPVRYAFVERLDQVLAGKNLLAGGFSVHDLLFGGSPVPLPPIDDFPGIGYREYGTLHEPAERLAVYGTYDDGSEEYEMCSGAVYDIFQWLSGAHSRKRSIVAFYY